MEESLRSCIVHFVTLVLSFFNPRKKRKEKSYILLLKNGITTMKKHVDANHVLLAKLF